MAGNFNLKVILAAVDRITPVLNGHIRTLNKWKRQMRSAGEGGVTMAAGLAAALIAPARAFADAESAAIGLKSALMTSDGVAGGFEKLNKLAIELGNQLPGTTADFSKMATVMKANGLATDSMINGGLKAAAYLAIATQGLGETYDSAALGITKISNVFGVADKDFVSLADTMQRVVNIGVGIEPFTSAMSKAGGAMKAVRQGGLGAAKDIAPLVALLVRAGVDASEAGTGLKKIISVAGGTGKFKNIQGMVENLEKMYKQDPAKLIAAFKEIFGEEHGGKAIIIAAGGYKQITEEMNKQASLDMRVQESLKSLTNSWDSATGTFTNAMVAFANSYAPEMKQLAGTINGLSGRLQVWATANGPMIKTAIEMAGAFVGLKLAFLAAAFGIGVLTKVMKVNPYFALIGFAIEALILIHNNRDAINEFFLKTIPAALKSVPAMFDAVAESMKSSWNNALVWMDKKIQTFVDGLLLAVNAIRGMFNFSDVTVKLPKLSNEFSFSADKPADSKSSDTTPKSEPKGSWLDRFFDKTSSTSAHGMRPPSYSASIAKNAKSLPVLTQIKQSPAMESVRKVSEMPSLAAMQKAPVIKQVANVSRSNVVNHNFSQSSVVNQSAQVARQQKDRQSASPVERKPIIQPAAQAVKGSIDVNFNNAPQGLRVSESKTRGPVSVTPNVGYRSFATGAQ